LDMYVYIYVEEELENWCDWGKNYWVNDSGEKNNIFYRISYTLNKRHLYILFTEETFWVRLWLFV
jgi:hypothetical protein